MSVSSSERTCTMAVNPRKKIWIEAFTSYITSWLLIYGFNVVEKSSVLVLDFLASKARERKTARDRNAVWYEGFRDYIVKQMELQGITERKVEYGTTHYMIMPNTTMGKDEAGMRRFQNLIDTLGLKDAEELVNVTVRYIPEHEVEVNVRDPRYNNGREMTQTDIVEAHSVTEYTFVGEGDPEQELRWTIAMGNKPSFDVGPATKRVKQGKKRNQR